MVSFVSIRPVRLARAAVRRPGRWPALCRPSESSRLADQIQSAQAVVVQEPAGKLLRTHCQGRGLPKAYSGVQGAAVAGGRAHVTGLGWAHDLEDAEALGGLQLADEFMQHDRLPMAYIEDAQRCAAAAQSRPGRTKTAACRPAQCPTHEIQSRCGGPTLPSARLRLTSQQSLRLSTATTV